MARTQKISAVVTLCAALCAASFTAAPSASALAPPVPKITVHDPTKDVASPAGDVTGVGVLQNAVGTTFVATILKPSDPSTDQFWTRGLPLLEWWVDSNRDGKLDDDVRLTYSTSLHALQAVVASDPSEDKLCDGTPKYVAHFGYQVFVPSGCLPHFTTVRFGVDFVYAFDPENFPLLADLAPNAGLSKPIDVQQHFNGYWMLGGDGHVYAFGDSPAFAGLVPDASAMAPRRDGKGYWVVDRSGFVFPYGKAKYFGGAPPLDFGEFVSTISPTADGQGYWLFTNRGRVFHYGDAKFYGDMTGTALNGPIVASVASATGHGYYLVGSDGGIFAFGDAHFHGSTGGIPLNSPVVGIAPTPNGQGYWLVASDGGVFAFDAPFHGSMGGAHLNQPVNGLVAYGDGYLMVASDGGIFDFSNQQFLGSLAEHPPTAPIIGVAAFFF